MRIDQQLAEKWIKPGSSVLDLGCGDGELLAHMSQKHQIRAYGLEIDQEKDCNCCQSRVKYYSTRFESRFKPFCRPVF